MQDAEKPLGPRILIYSSNLLLEQVYLPFMLAFLLSWVAREPAYPSPPALLFLRSSICSCVAILALYYFSEHAILVLSRAHVAIEETSEYDLQVALTQSEGDCL